MQSGDERRQIGGFPMSLPELGQDVMNALERICELAEEKLDEPKNINIYLADDGDVHISASHNEADESERKQWDCYYRWEKQVIEWKRSDPVIRYKELVDKSRNIEKEEILDG
jgi:hypothetical protein